MPSSNEDLAVAFSSHRFAEVAPHLAEDVRWVAVGGGLYQGRDAVVAACEESGSYLATVQTDFRLLRTVVSDSAAVVDSLADYTEPDGSVLTVSSCDLYDFRDGKLAEITSYTVELAPKGERAG